MHSMVKRLVLLAFWMGIFHVPVSAENIRAPQNALLSHLLTDTIPVLYITYSPKAIIPIEGNFSDFGQQLVKTSKGLYIFIAGTGRVYKVTAWSDKWVDFTRLDSTNYFGYNFGAAKFIVNDTIYSFGGYGFWHFNGQLLHLTKQSEWDINPLNKEIAFLNNGFYPFQIGNDFKRFYWYAGNVSNSSVIENTILDSIYELDISQKRVTTLGKSALKMYDFLKNTHLQFQVITPYGILLDVPSENNKDFLLDISTNTVYETDQERIFQNLLSSRQKTEDKVMFYQNGNIYSTEYPFNHIDSIKFDFSVFKKLELNVYLPIKNSNLFAGILTNFSLLQIIFFLIFSFSIVLFILRFKKLKPLINKTIKNEMDNELLSPLEKGLLKDFIDRLRATGNCTTEELNSLLGVSQKSIEIQKKSRTDFITRINQKLKDDFKLTEDIITRTRSENDGRSYLYSITAENIKRIKKIL